MADRSNEHDMILVIDFGAQYSQLITRRIRECNVYCEMWPYTTPVSEIREKQPKGIILSGGPSSVYADDAPRIDLDIFDLGIPLLGICYGMQLMAHVLGGTVRPAAKREYGRAELSVADYGDLFKGLEFDASLAELVCWMSHGDFVEEAPPDFEVIAGTENAPAAAMRHGKKPLYAVQFHPEVHHTPKGKEILRNFAVDICGCDPTWTMGNFVEDQVALIRDIVGDKHVVCGLSGGIDSSTAAALVHQAIGDQLVSIYVDHGFMRKGESEQVEETFRSRFGRNFIHVDAQDRFMDKLSGISDPETKRKRIGNEFIRVFEEEASGLKAQFGDIEYLVQGTLYPDVIESGTGSAQVIKSHHNVGGLPEDMELKLIEPLRDLFKDEVRVLAEELALPDEIVWRQPFPGPGLAIRVMGPIEEERVRIVREADYIVVDEIKKAGLYKDVWQAFAVLTATKSVGVVGDTRSYGYVVAVRAVGSSDGMTADWFKLPYGVLERISNRIINEVDQVARVVYDISSKPPGTIEWE